MLRTVLTATIALFLAAPLLAAGSDDRAIQDLASSDPALQIQACRTLGAARSTAAVSPLINLLQSSTDAHVAASAAAALGAIGEKGPATQALLRAAGENESDLVKYAALLALANLADDEQKAATIQAAGVAAASKDPLLADLAQKLEPVLKQ